MEFLKSSVDACPQMEKASKGGMKKKIALKQGCKTW
jgi:hypothetical protein